MSTDCTELFSCDFQWETATASKQSVIRLLY